MIHMFERMFDWPAGLELFAAAAGVVLMILWSRRQTLARLAPWPRLRDVRRRNFSRSWLLGTVLGLGFLTLAVAGPRWLTRSQDPLGPGRDVMIVLDLSRSMNAEQPTRAAKAIRSLRNFTYSDNLPPGTRVGLVVFAAKPAVVFPLTRDLDHLGWTLDRLANDDVPANVRGDPAGFVSGTRIGAALRLAVESLGESRAGQQDIVLLSDGDDPIDDDEWRSGITAARQAGVPVHVVAVGEPGAATIPERDDVLRHDGAPVRTMVRRDRLDPIASATGGALIPLPRGEVPLATTLAERWTDTPVSTASSGVSTWRTPWIVAAFVALLITLGLYPKRTPLSPRGEGCSSPRDGNWSCQFSVF